MGTDIGPAPAGGRDLSESSPERAVSTASGAGGGGMPAASPASPASPALPDRAARWELSKADFYSGAVFIAFGCAFAVASSQYTVGTLLRMGPGYFPRLLGIILAVMGVVIVALAVFRFLRLQPAHAAAEDQPVAWVRGGLLLGAIVLFGFVIGGAGLLPTVLVTTFIAALAGQGTTPARAVVIAAGITALCVLIFVFLLRLTVPLFGPWVGG